MALIDNYVLERDFMASTRLRLQHYALTELQGWFLPPDIDRYIKSLDKPKVGDLATGNAIWATDLVDRYPHAEVTGLDISDEQFPMKSQLPSNISLGVHNMFDDVPDKYRNAFDLVHLRLTVGWMYDHDAATLLKNALSMLKPGGYIQWAENVGPDAAHSRDIMWIVSPDFSYTGGFPEWLTPIRSPALMDGFAWLQKLPELYREHGLADVQTFRHEPRRTVLQTHNDLIRWLLIEAHQARIRAGVPGSQESFEADMKAMNADMAKGYSYVYGWTVMTGRKPLE